ncbi:hypothetical protein DPMN_052562 [Dreissena polymorpha]|uniref:CAAX prenyl protease 1 N-terminal domain-containing protein n=1 Tax=Dreissena polymorpha TaxID=45954 RepID=A0A9D4CJW8_DREPO|nr:hypothetical protein DPMN_052562 [Dreissena polymorpha]
MPFTVYSTFVIEERHGFNKQTPGLFCERPDKEVLRFAGHRDADCGPAHLHHSDWGRLLLRLRMGLPPKCPFLETIFNVQNIN